MGGRHSVIKSACLSFGVGIFLLAATTRTLSQGSAGFRRPGAVAAPLDPRFENEEREALRLLFTKQFPGEAIACIPEAELRGFADATGPAAAKMAEADKKVQQKGTPEEELEAMVGALRANTAYQAAYLSALDRKLRLLDTPPSPSARAARVACLDSKVSLRRTDLDLAMALDLLWDTRVPTGTGGFVAGFVPKPRPVARSLGESTEWRTHLDWCSGNSDAGGSVDCVAAYMVSYPECVASGGRACLMNKARAAARANNCDHALELALRCQCHNDAARSAIEDAGVTQVCNYLGPPTVPTQPTASSRPPTRVLPAPPSPTTWFRVQSRFACAWDSGFGPAGDCTDPAESPISCAAAYAISESHLKAAGDGCKICDPQKHAVSERRWVQAGPCQEGNR